MAGNPYHCAAGTGLTGGRFTDAQGSTCAPFVHQLSETGLQQRSLRLRNVLQGSLSVERREILEGELEMVRTEQAKRLEMVQMLQQGSLFPTPPEAGQLPIDRGWDQPVDGISMRIADGMLLSSEDNSPGAIKAREAYDEALAEVLAEPKIRALAEKFGLPRFHIFVDQYQAAGATVYPTTGGAEAVKQFLKQNPDFSPYIGVNMKHLLEETVDSRLPRFNVDISRVGILRHELGHWFEIKSVENQIEDSPSGVMFGTTEPRLSSRKMFYQARHDAIGDPMKVGNVNEIRDNISQYAMYNASETQAEIFNIVMARGFNRDDWNDYPQTTQDLLDMVISHYEEALEQ